jgi:hypothetical protein
MHVEAEGHLVAATPEAASWFTGEGALVRELAFPEPLARLEVVPREGAALLFVGSTDSHHRKLVFVPAGGGEPWRARVEGLHARLGQLVEGPELEIVSAHGEELVVCDLRGRPIRRMRAGSYVWDLWALQTNHTPLDEVVTYRYRTRAAGTDIDVLDASGERIRSWHEEAASRYSVSHWSAPRQTLVAVRDGTITERAATGEVLRQFVVPGLGTYRYADTASLAGGLKAILVRQGGCAARLLVFDAAGALRYDEVFDGHAHLAAQESRADGGTRTFFIARGATIWKYTLDVAAGPAPTGSRR